MNTDEVLCPECGASMLLRETSKYLTRDGKPTKFYGCSRFPRCKGSHGAHPDGTPLGVPVKKAIKALRIKAHALCDQIWGPWSTLTRAQKENIHYCINKYGCSRTVHFAEMDEEELLRIIEYLEEVLSLKGVRNDLRNPIL